MQRTASHLVVRFWSKVDRRGADECWPWLAALDSHGYGQTVLAGRHMSSSRVAFILSHPEIKLTPEIHVCHTCDVRQCCNPAHLFLGDNAINTADRDAKGRTARGSTLASAKLTGDQVIELRRRWAAGASVRSLAHEYGVSASNLSHVLRRKTWTHLP